MDSRQFELNRFRNKLGLSPWMIDKRTKAPFSESLREYCRYNDINYHVEVDCSKKLVDLYMTVGNDTVTVSGKVGNQSMSYPDELDQLEDTAAKQLISMD